MHLNGISNSTTLARTERYMYVGANRDGTPGRKRETFSLRSNNSSSSSSRVVVLVPGGAASPLISGEAARKTGPIYPHPDLFIHLFSLYIYNSNSFLFLHYGVQ